MAFAALPSLLLQTEFDIASSPEELLEWEDPGILARFMVNGGNVQMMVGVFLFSFCFFMLLTNFTRLGGPTVEQSIQIELKSDLQALGPFKLVKQQGSTVEVLSKEQTLIFAKVLWRHDLKLRTEQRKHGLKERRTLHRSQSWPFYEGSHDRLVDGLLQTSKELEMTAVTCVGLSRRNWLESLQVHFPYPSKDQALVNLYKEVVLEFRKRDVEELLADYTVDSTGPAWRWIVINEAELEQKMVKILHTGDRDLYHRVVRYEAAKLEDQLHSEFGVEYAQFLDIENHLKLREQDHTVVFTTELQEMLEGKE